MGDRATARSRPTSSEAEIGASLVAWLTERGWDVYQEVAPATYSARADIVALRGPLLYVVECKQAFGFAVLKQARTWLRSANLVSVATGWGRVSEIQRHVCDALGIGWLAASTSKPGDVVERVSPALRRRVSDDLRRTLRDEHKTHAKAGTNGGYFSAWRGTCARLAELVATCQFGIEPKYAVQRIKHHYATDKSARACLTTEVAAGKVPGVELLLWGDERRFFPVRAKKTP